MGSFEWMELQTLTSDINASRSRLAAARANKDNRLVRVLEAEITAAEQRRDSLLAHITTNLAGSGEPAQNQPAAKAVADAEPAAAVAELEEPAAAAEAEAPVPAEQPAEESTAGDSADQAGANGALTVVAAAPETGSVEGGGIVWDQLTPSDIERAQAEIGVRRAEMLARHAEELKALEAEQVELEGLEKAINTFLQRVGKAPAATEANAA